MAFRLFLFIHIPPRVCLLNIFQYSISDFNINSNNNKSFHYENQFLCFDAYLEKLHILRWNSKRVNVMCCTRHGRVQQPSCDVSEELPKRRSEERCDRGRRPRGGALGLRRVNTQCISRIFSNALFPFAVVFVPFAPTPPQFRSSSDSESRKSNNYFLT